MDEDTRKTIESELDMAARAIDQGNEGKARVCCRRAAGAAIGALLVSDPGRNYGNTAISRLELLSGDSTVDEDVRHAAFRLRSKRSDDGGKNVSRDPLADVGLILEYVHSRLKNR